MQVATNSQTAMSLAPHVDPFTGTDWEECNGFIRALRSRALWEGKQRDPAWIADFAAPYFSQKALLWHCRLPQDVRQDWFKLEIALLERWAPSEDDNEAQIKPTPAAAPSVNMAELPLQGVLRVTLNKSNKTFYAKFDPARGCLALTDQVAEALSVRCSSLSSGALLERTDGSCHSWLAVQWYVGCRERVPKLWTGSTDYSYLTLVNSETMKPPSKVIETPWQLMTCPNLDSTNGEVIPRWKHGDTSSSLVLMVDATTSTVQLVPDPDAFSKRFPNDRRAKLFIQPAE